MSEQWWCRFSPEFDDLRLSRSAFMLVVSLLKSSISSLRSELSRLLRNAPTVKPRFYYDTRHVSKRPRQERREGGREGER
jgi:hypothetical protein